MQPGRCYPGHPVTHSMRQSIAVSVIKAETANIDSRNADPYGENTKDFLYFLLQFGHFQL
jgi:hypothetical protein